MIDLRVYLYNILVTASWSPICFNALLKKDSWHDADICPTNINEIMEFLIKSLFLWVQK